MQDRWKFPRPWLFENWVGLEEDINIGKNHNMNLGGAVYFSKRIYFIIADYSVGSPSTISFLLLLVPRLVKSLGFSVQSHLAFWYAWKSDAFLARGRFLDTCWRTTSCYRGRETSYAGIWRTCVMYKQTTVGSVCWVCTSWEKLRGLRD